ncbi:MAG: hypothetical protein D6785_10725, partial [Planctomycetota bacterium]
VKILGFITIGHVNGVNIPEWPVSFEKLWKNLLNSGRLKKSIDTLKNTDPLNFLKNVGSLDYKVKGVVDPSKAVHLKGLHVKAKGANLEVDGKLENLEGKLVETDGSTKIRINLGESELASGDSKASIGEGTYELTGTHKLEIPLEKGKKMAIYFDGEGKYSFKNGVVDLKLPNEKSIFLEGIEGSGAHKITLNDLAKGLEGLEIRDGTIHLKANGAARIRSLDKDSFFWGDMPLNNNLVLDSRYDLEKGEIKTITSFRMVSEVEGPGILDALKFQPLKGARIKTKLVKENRFEINMDKVKTAWKLGEELKKAKVEGRGKVRFMVNTVGGEGSYRNFKALLEGENTFSGESEFGITNTPNGPGLGEDSYAKAWINLALRKGTKLTLFKDGKATTIVIQGDQSHIRFLAEVGMRNGKPYFKEARQVDIVLELGNIEANLLGLQVRGNGKKVIVMEKGRIRFRNRGVDIYGNLAVRLEGSEDTPLFSVDW